jgi:hypothetical protein
MLEQAFIESVRAGQPVSFQDTMNVISVHYDYFPTEFSNGLNPVLINEAGRNEGSCKIFAFAKLHGFNSSQTLALFGDYYLIDVLGNPDGQDHQNIRNFMRDGWDGIHFQGEALKSRHAD